MLYCKRCGKLHRDGARLCENCGKNVYETEDINTPSYLVTACGFERSNIEGALTDNEIAFIEKPEKNETGANALTGSYSENHRILVPFQAYAKAREIIAGLGVTADCDFEDDELNEEAARLRQALPEASGTPDKKLTGLMLVLFLLLIAAAVFFTDTIMGWIKGLFM